MDSPLDDPVKTLQQAFSDKEVPLCSPVYQNTAFQTIGFGFTGLVFETGPTMALKVARRLHDDSLWNDLVVQTKVFESFQSAGEREVRVPKPYGYVNAAQDDHSTDW